MWECSQCNKSFQSKDALRQHNNSKHQDNDHKHAPPHDGIEGYWIRRKNFNGSKSFGRFKCPKCKKAWGSAHAYKKYKQGCKRCEKKSLPCCMWVNTGDDDRDIDRDKDHGPHDSARCEACRYGKCTRE